MLHPTQTSTTTVVDLLTARALEEPNRAALIQGESTLAFGQWEELSARIARTLVGRGVRIGDRIGLLYGSHDWVRFAVGYVAVLKAGAVAVPVPARLAAVQVQQVLEHCGAVGAIDDTGRARTAALSCWLLSHDDALADSTPAQALVVDVGADSLAQILYTSGTTGVPKGVSATHANLAYGHASHPRRRRYAHSQHFLHAFGIGTNAGQLMLIDALVAAPTAIAAPRFDVDTFCGLIEQHGVGTVFMVPSMAIDLLNAQAPTRFDLSSVMLLSSSAAALPAPVALELSRAFPRATIVNYYTSTEAVPAQTAIIVDVTRPASVGRVTDTADLMIARPDGSRAPAGEVGEVWLRAPAEPRAYYGDADATAATFRPGWIRMGDEGYLDPEGYLFLTDRMSDVVKSGGLKISTLQVESVLFEHPLVADAAVVGIPHPVMGKMIAAAIVSRTGTEITGLRDFLGSRLAREEIPTRFSYRESLPLTDSGKVDKRSLIALFTESTQIDPSSAAPSTATELALARIWERVLRAPKISAGSDFFALGGDSLKAAQLAALTQQTFATSTPVAFVFDTPVLADQAHWLDGHHADTPESAPAPSWLPNPDAVPLTSLQEYFLRWMYETTPPRVVSAVHAATLVHGTLDAEVLRASLEVLTQRHVSLRMVFPNAGPNGPGLARILETMPAEVVELSATSREEAGKRAAVELERPFDIHSGPLARIVLIQLPDDEHLLVVGVHHTVCDGWSIGLLLRDLGIAYSALAAGDLPAQRSAALTYADLMTWAQLQWHANAPFWRQVLGQAPPGFRSAPGRRRVGRFTAASIELGLEVDDVERLRRIAGETGTTMFMVVATAWADVLSGWTGQRDLVLMSPVPGRTRPEHEPVVGCLVQSLLLPVLVTDGGTFRDLLAAVRRTVLDSLQHQFYPYDEFARQIPYPAWLRYDTWGDGARIPGLDCTPFDLPPELMLDWPLKPGEIDHGVPELALSEQLDGSLSGALVFNRRAFDRSRIEGLKKLFTDYVRRLSIDDEEAR